MPCFRLDTRHHHYINHRWTLTSCRIEKIFGFQGLTNTRSLTPAPGKYVGWVLLSGGRVGLVRSCTGWAGSKT